MLKMKSIEGRACPTPFCDFCGREIEGGSDDPGASVWVVPTTADKASAYAVAFVHKNDARNGDRCMDRWEAQHARTQGDAGMAWNDLHELPMFVFNNPGFQHPSHKYKIVKGPVSTRREHVGNDI
jgi:hypothetical protein